MLNTLVNVRLAPEICPSVQGISSHETRILKQREAENRLLGYRSHVQVLAIEMLHSFLS